ncbi:hypothetical protein S40285_04119 [Stachybotrys chlorohalonatus IBT 40285]|uniref:Nicotinamide-nucleotide adenylyltransferase n=1 Tax=Stachybotrys chlorohalonatus (strain IBT 40285) TaxID=1283841 RepID=A0A084QI24_STAC4|nr:hypothetical protein S40285_04119 [Stachybotrys chlorohalonata IBT 40285]
MSSAFDYDYVKDKTPAGYVFPSARLHLTGFDPASTRTPLVLVACGSFSPITFLHLRMFFMARDHARNEGFEVVGGYLSPVSSAYQKRGLAPAHHRIRMCELAADQHAAGRTKWLMVDPWEGDSSDYLPTARVLDHFDYEINQVRGGVECTDGSRRPVKIVLLAGADLIQTISTPEVWDPRDVDHILGDFGVFVLERSGVELESALESLQQWERNIHVIRQVVQNDVSSTKIRLLLKRDMSIDYLIPEPVIDYIEQHNLYRELDIANRDDVVMEDKEKGKALEKQPIAGPSKG